MTTAGKLNLKTKAATKKTKKTAPKKSEAAVANDMVVAVDAKEIGMNANDIERIRVWLTETRVQQCAQSLTNWLRIGDICTRIKSSTMEGKFKDNVNTILGCEITNDERQYSMKLHDAEKDVIAWYKSVNCMKYNPRTIWTAFASKDEVEKTPEQKEEAKEAKAEKQLRKERTGADALKSFIEYRKIRDKAGEDGNLVLGDLKTLEDSLKAELIAIEQMIKAESV